MLSAPSCNMTLLRTLSRGSCDLGRTFGCDTKHPRTIWVADGCRGDFLVAGEPLRCGSWQAKGTLELCSPRIVDAVEQVSWAGPWSNRTALHLVRTARTQSQQPVGSSTAAKHHHAVHVCLLAYNERVLIRHTLAFYRQRLPHASFTVLDNNSSDGTPELAAALGATIWSFSTRTRHEPDGRQDEDVQLKWKTMCWKHAPHAGWQILVDADEWLDVTEDQLADEAARGYSLLTTQGIEIVGRSQKADLSDVADMTTMVRGVPAAMESKPCLAFHSGLVLSLGNTIGSHHCKPVPLINARWTKRVYANLHMRHLGFPYLLGREVRAYARTGSMRHQHLDLHYTNNATQVRKRYEAICHHPKLLTDYRTFMTGLTRDVCKKQRSC